MEDWKNVTTKCLEVASDYFKATSEEPFGNFMDVVVEFLCNVKTETAKFETTTSEATPKVVLEPVKVLKPYHRARKDYSDKSLSSRFEGMLVYVGDYKGEVNPKSIARIIPGDTEKSKDLFKLDYSGDTFTLSDYMKTFKLDGNLSRIRFVANPKVSLWMCKTTHFDVLKTSSDVFNYQRKKTKAVKGV